MYENVDEDLFFNNNKWFPRDAEHRLLSEMGYELDEEESVLTFYKQLDDYLKSPDVIYKNLDRVRNKYVSESVAEADMTKSDYFSERSLNLKAFTFKNKHDPQKPFTSLRESIFSKIPNEEDTVDVTTNVLDALFEEDKKAKEQLAKQRNDIKVELKDFTIRAHKGKIKPKGYTAVRDPLDFKNRMGDKLPPREDHMEFPSEDDSTLREETSMASARFDASADATMFDKDHEFKAGLEAYEVQGIGADSAKPKTKVVFVKKPEEELIKERLNNTSFARDREETVPAEEKTVMDVTKLKDAVDGPLFANKEGFKRELQKFSVVNKSQDKGYKDDLHFRQKPEDQVTLKEEPTMSNVHLLPDSNDPKGKQARLLKAELKKFKVLGIERDDDSLEEPIISRQMKVDQPEIIPAHPAQTYENIIHRNKLAEEPTLGDDIQDESLMEHNKFKEELKRFQISGLANKRQVADRNTIFKNPHAYRRKFMQRRVDSMTLEGMESDMVSDADANDRSPGPQNTMVTEQASVDMITPNEMINRHIEYNTNPNIPPRALRQQFDSLLTNSDITHTDSSPTDKSPVKSFTNVLNKPSEPQILNANLARTYSKISDRNKMFDMESVSIRQSELSEGGSLVDSQIYDNKDVVGHRQELKKFGVKAHENSKNPAFNPEEIENRDSRYDMPTPSIGSIILTEEHSRQATEMDDSFKKRLHVDILTKFKVQPQTGDTQKPADKQEKLVFPQQSVKPSRSQTLNSMVVSEEPSMQPSDLNDSSRMAMHREMLRKFKIAGHVPTAALNSPKQAPRKDPVNVVANILETSFDKKRDKTRELSKEIKKDIIRASGKDNKKDFTVELPRDRSVETMIQTVHSTKHQSKPAEAPKTTKADLLQDLSNEVVRSKGHTNEATVGNNRPGNAKLPKLADPKTDKSKEQAELEESFKMRAVRDSKFQEGIVDPLVDCIDDFLEEVEPKNDRKISGDSFDFNVLKQKLRQDLDPQEIGQNKKVKQGKNVQIQIPDKPKTTDKKLLAIPDPASGPKKKSKWELEEEFNQKSNVIMLDNIKAKNPKKNVSFHSQFTDRYYDFQPFDNDQQSAMMNSLDLGTVIPDKKGVNDHSMTQVKILAELIGQPTKSPEQAKAKQSNNMLQPPAKSKSSKPEQPTIPMHVEMPMKEKGKFNMINKPSIGKDDDFFPTPVREPLKSALKNPSSQRFTSGISSPSEKKVEIVAKPNIFAQAFEERQKAKDDPEDTSKARKSKPDIDMQPQDLKSVLLQRMGYEG